MIPCPRCNSPVDETVRTTCPLCFTPLNAQATEPPPPTQAAPAPGLAPPMPPQRPVQPQMPPAARPANVRVSLTGEVMENVPASQPVQPGGYAGGSLANPPPMSAALPTAPARPPMGMSPRRETVPDNSDRKALIINVSVVLTLLLLCAGGIGWRWTHRTNPKSQVERYLHAIQWLDWRVVYELSASPPGNKTRRDFVSMMNDKYDNNGLLKIVARRSYEKITFDVAEPTFQDDGATVSVTMNGSTLKENGPTVFKLKNFSGVWKIEPLAENPLEIIGAAASKGLDVPALPSLPTGGLSAP